MRPFRLHRFSAPAVVLAALALGSSASAQTTVADFQDDFETGAPAAGWRYLWNANGALGNPANYVPLVADNGRYETVANGAYPDAAPGSFLTAGSGPVDPLRFPANPPPDPFGLGIVLPPLPNTFVRPGQGTAQAPNSIERAVVLAYTFSAADVAAFGGEAYFTDYYFAVSTTSLDPVTARVYRDDDAAPILDFVFPPGFAFQTTLDPDPIPLGTYAAGETVYIALGSGFTDAAGGDELRLDFTIALVPEPASAALLAGLGGALLLRRRR